MPGFPVPQKSDAGTAGFHNYFPHRTDKPTQNGQPEPDQNGRKNQPGAGRALAGGRPSNVTKRTVQKKVAVARVSCTFFRAAPKHNHLEDLYKGRLAPIPTISVKSDGVIPTNDQPRPTQFRAKSRGGASLGSKREGTNTPCQKNCAAARVPCVFFRTAPSGVKKWGGMLSPSHPFEPNKLW